jgi:putative peptide-modifying radical SAM enzyme
MQHLRCTGKQGIVMFYGGEPTLNLAFIEKFMAVSDGSGLRYGLQTNGTLLDEVCAGVLKRLDVIFVSVDGVAQVHDRYRGTGTFAQIMRNIPLARNRGFSGDTIARMTLMPEASLYESVSVLLRIYDAVFWQLENSPSSFPRMKEFELKYQQDIKQLVTEWIDQLQQGTMSRIIPFLAVSRMLLDCDQNDSPPCGCGSSLVYIDCDGKCFACDRMRNRAEFAVGDIDIGICFKHKWRRNLNEMCRTCDIGHICGGRCVPAMLYYGKEKLLFYCRLTKYLVEALRSVNHSIASAISSGSLRREYLDDISISLTEQIP